MAPRIVSVKTRGGFVGDESRNPLRDLWEWYSSLDKFFQSSLLVMGIIILLTPVLISGYLVLNSHAASTYNYSTFEYFEEGTYKWFVTADRNTSTTPSVGNYPDNPTYPGINCSTSNKVAHLHFNWGANGQYAGIRFNTYYVLPNAKSATLGYWVKTSTPGIATELLIADAYGELFYYQPERSFDTVFQRNSCLTDVNSWYEQIVKLDAPLYYTGGSGGTTGKIDYPIKTMEVLAIPRYSEYNPSHKEVYSGDIWIDNIAWVDSNTTTVYREVDLASPTISVPNTTNQFSSFGVSSQGNMQTTLPYMEQTKGQLFRTDMFWANVETSPGVYNFSQYDSIYTAARNAGMKVLFVLDYGNPLYTNTSSCTNTSSNNNWCPPLTSTALNAYTNFAVAAAKHYLSIDPNATSNLAFEVWNEPYNAGFWGGVANDDVHYSMLETRTVYDIHAYASPYYQVTTAAIANNYPYFQNYRHDVSNTTYNWAPYTGEHANAIATHPYRQDIPESFTDDLAYTRYASFGLPVWVTEWGYPTDSTWWNLAGVQRLYLKRQTDLQTLQANMDVREILTNMSLGLPYGQMYKLNDIPNTGDYFGLIVPTSTGFSYKKSFNAVTVMANLLNGYHFVGLVPSYLTNMHIMKFANGDNTSTMLVLWQDGDISGGSAPIVYFKNSGSYVSGSAYGYDSNFNEASYGTVGAVAVGDSPKFVVFSSVASAPTPTPLPTATPTPTSVNPTPTPTPLPTPTPTLAPNIVKNYSFESASGTSYSCPLYSTTVSPASYWSFVVAGTGKGCAVRDSSTATNGSYSMRLQTSQVDTNAYNIDLYQVGLTISQGHTYTVSFDAKASASRTILVGVRQLVSPYAAYSPNQTISLGTGWQHYSFTFTMSYATDTNARLLFGVANTTGYVWIDNVSIQ